MVLNLTVRETRVKPQMTLFLCVFQLQFDP